MVVDTASLDEQRLLRLSLYAAGAFVLMALGFALLTRSGSILFDGIYSLISFFMTVLTVKVANLVARPDDERFHFGYTAMEPTLNLFKSLIVIVTCVFAVFGAFNRLLAGGNSAEYGLAIVYGVLATIGCFLVAWIMKRRSQHFKSDLVGVEAKTWFIDGLLSGSILLGFIIAWSFEHSTLSIYAPQVDPILLIILGLAILPIPGKILLESLKEVVNKAPPETVVKEIERRLKKSLLNINYDHVELRVSKRGRDLYLLVHVVVSDSFANETVSQLDEIRRNSEKEMKKWNPAIMIDMLFVRDRLLAG
ncbi:cation diffusion facilitator family transporter [Paraglaciecola sp. L1A13]|uniref:cation diffusion facilitator family transporter n=1 Tax=Paraglaciecola sp. L1A13 TaxID=2686359 RepID=UPI00131C47BB|nr:cation diffusion facilitator family transporter [Paraglaciecola sp. L1A13]|tara:strand:- start:20220 stop:21140 length:921 start_codon:yes stop_codon:yes gene_type:complete